MTITQTSITITDEEKVKVAYALNLCAASITQIIDSKDIVILKQERELILGNLNIQNFVKHPALLDVIKQILNAITYYEIQAGDLSFIEREYQQKLKNAIWTAVPSPSVFFSSGGLASTAVAIATQIGIGYMNYRRNKNQYLLDKEKGEWELRKHEIEQLNSLRNLLFETAWRLSSDYDFNDELRLTERQINRYSAALLEPDPLKRYERLDVMSDKFGAFPQFWYYKGNAAMEIFRSNQYGNFATEFKAEAIKAYNMFQNINFEFLREDVVAASCCLEHISLLEPSDANIPELLRKAVRFAGDNFDVLQQSILVNLQLGNMAEVVLPLRQMIANGYNVGLNGILLSRIYFTNSNRIEYEKLRAIAGEDNILPWSENAGLSEKQLLEARKLRISNEYISMAQRIIIQLKTNKSSTNVNSTYDRFSSVSASLLRYTPGSKELGESFKTLEGKLKQAIINTADKTLREFFTEAQQLGADLLAARFTMQIAEDTPNLIDKMQEVAKA